jgi:ribose-phosphate pyrophosphokinase
VEPFADAAALLKERGAYKVYVMVTHGILSGDCVRLIEDSDIDEVINPSIISTDDIQWSSVDSILP